MTAREQLDDELEGYDALVADGYDDCILGTVEIFGYKLALYDRDKILTRLESDGATPEEAEEFYNVNIVGAYAGTGTPAYAHLFRPS